MAIGINYQDGVSPTVLHTSDEVAGFFDTLRGTANPPAVLAMVFIAEEPTAQAMQVGIHDDRGWVTYGKDGDAWISHGSDAEGEVLYYFQRTHTHEVPAAAEVPYPQVVHAVQQFLAKDGARPSNLEWVED